MWFERLAMECQAVLMNGRYYTIIYPLPLRLVYCFVRNYVQAK